METGCTRVAAPSGEAQRTAHFRDETRGHQAGQGPETGGNANYFSKTAATVCGDCLAFALGVATTLSLALLQGGAVLADVCWRAIRKSCCDTGKKVCATGAHWLQTYPPMYMQAAFHARMRLSTSLPKRFNTCIRSLCGCTYPVRPAVTTAEHPTLSFPILVRPICREGVRLRGVSGASLYKGKAVGDLEWPLQAHHELLHLHLPATPAGTLADADAGRREERRAAAVRTIDRHESSPARAWDTQHSCLHRVGFTRRGHLPDGRQTPTNCMLSTVSHRSHGASSPGNGSRSLFCCASTQQYSGECREKMGRSFCGRDRLQRDTGVGRIRLTAAVDGTFISALKSTDCDSIDGREKKSGRVCQNSAATSCVVKEERARLRHSTKGVNISQVQPAAVDILAEGCTSSGHETEMPTLATACRKRAINMKLTIQKEVVVAHSGLTEEAPKSPQKASTPVRVSSANLPHVTAEQLQRTAEQMFLSNRSASSERAVIRSEPHASERSGHREAAAAGCGDVPWRKVLGLVHRWYHALVSVPDPISLKFTHSPVSRSPPYPGEACCHSVSIESSEAGQGLSGQGTAWGENHQRAGGATRVAPVVDYAYSGRETNASGKRAAGPRGFDGSLAGEEDSSFSVSGENASPNHGSVAQGPSEGASHWKPRETAASGTLSFYPPIFTEKGLMPFQLPCQELRNDVIRPFLRETANGEESTTQAQPDTGTDTEKPSFWGRYFCLQNFSPVPESRAELE